MQSDQEKLEQSKVLKAFVDSNKDRLCVQDDEYIKYLEKQEEIQRGKVQEAYRMLGRSQEISEYMEIPSKNEEITCNSPRKSDSIDNKGIVRLKRREGHENLDTVRSKFKSDGAESGDGVEMMSAEQFHAEFNIIG